jgi:2-aminoethylphosphonate-pyruvate transaminase
VVKVTEKVKSDKEITHVAVIHSETTSGLINPIQELGKSIKSINPNLIYIVDAMSSFGAYKILY